MDLAGTICAPHLLGILAGGLSDSPCGGRAPLPTPSFINPKRSVQVIFFFHVFQPLLLLPCDIFCPINEIWFTALPKYSLIAQKLFYKKFLALIEDIWIVLCLFQFSMMDSQCLLLYPCLSYGISIYVFCLLPIQFITNQESYFLRVVIKRAYRSDLAICVIWDWHPKSLVDSTGVYSCGRVLK